MLLIEGARGENPSLKSAAAIVCPLVGSNWSAIHMNGQSTPLSLLPDVYHFGSLCP